MPITKIEQKALWQNSPELATSRMFTDLRNCYIDIFGHITKRPGYIEWFNVGTSLPIDGTYWWSRQSKLVVVSGGQVFTTDINGNVTSCTGDTPVSGTKATFATNGSKVFIANGGRILVLDTSNVCTYIADGDAPTKVTYVIALDLYIICNSVGTGKIFWSDVNDYTNWNALSFATAETKSDDLYALFESWRELALFGDRSIETWYDDGVNPFSRMDGGYIEDGTLSPYTIQKIDNTYYYLNTKAQVVSISGRTPSILSVPIDREIQGYSNLENAFAFQLNLDGRYLYCITFPSDNITWVYDLLSKGWARWTNYDTGFAADNMFVASCSEFIPKLNLWVIGDNGSTGKVYKISPLYYDDDGNDTRYMFRTGHISHGSLVRKRNRGLTCRFTRGEVVDSDATFMIKWRTDKGVWSNERWFSVGTVGEESTIKLQRTGIYRTRQYEIVYTGSTPFTFIEAEENIEPLGV